MAEGFIPTQTRVLRTVKGSLDKKLDIGLFTIVLYEPMTEGSNPQMYLYEQDGDYNFKETDALSV